MIDHRSVGGDELVALLTGGRGEVIRDAGLVVVEDRPRTASDGERRAAIEALATVAGVVVAGPGWGGYDGPDWALVDVGGADEAELDAILRSIDQHPLAAGALAIHLRGAERRGVRDGLVAESMLYSMLQAGPEFRSWRKATAVRERSTPAAPAVRAEREGGVLTITLSRPEVRNALNVQMRDELLDALAVAVADPALEVVVRGDGPAFCSGGDLDEFGTSPDPVTAHAVRLERSVGAVLDGIADRVTFHLHGACFGAGIELPAFAKRVVAAPSTMICLPELGLGLAPGAGGTVSLKRRIGRLATAWLAFSRLPIGPEQAHVWGLVDEVAAA